MEEVIKKIKKENKIPYKNKTFQFATDCSGIEMPLNAFKALGLKYNVVFSSDIDKNCKDYIIKNHKPNKFYDNIKQRKNKDYTNVPIDFYVAGFPCQTFSSLGRNEGFDNEKKGQIFFDVFNFIKTNRPKVFILENVRHLTFHDKGNTFKVIQKYLKKLKDYDVKWKLLNTKDYGIPQTRTRIYIIGIKKSLIKKPFEFPKEYQIKKGAHALLSKSANKTIKPRHKEKLKQIFQKHPQLRNKNYIINLNFSSMDWFRKGQEDLCPCLVTSCDFYSTKDKRYITPYEALRFQGILKKDLKQFKPYSDNVIYKFAGNTMSANVLAWIFVNILNSVNFAKKN